jgi:hypothetical protein
MRETSGLQAKAEKRDRRRVEGATGESADSNDRLGEVGSRRVVKHAETSSAARSRQQKQTELDKVDRGDTIGDVGAGKAEIVSEEAKVREPSQTV